MSTPHPCSPRFLLLCPGALACDGLQQAGRSLGKLFLNEEPGQEFFIGRLGFRSPRRNLNRLRGGAAASQWNAATPYQGTSREDSHYLVGTGLHQETKSVEGLQVLALDRLLLYIISLMYMVCQCVA